MDSNISFVPLINFLFRKKLFIFFMMLLGFGVSYIYSYKREVIYQGYATIIAPDYMDTFLLSNIYSYGSPYSRFTKFTDADLFNIFIKHLTSENTKILFFNQFYYPYIQQNDNKSEAQAFREFSKNFKIRKNFQTNNSYYINLKTTAKEQIKTLVEQYIQITQKVSLEELQIKINLQKRSTLQAIESKLNMLKYLSKKQKLDELKELYEAVKEAKAAKIELFSSDNIPHNSLQTFMLGTKVLQERIRYIEQEPYSFSDREAIRTLQMDKKFYSNIKKLPHNIKLYQLEGKVSVVPASLINNRIILFLGALLGCILSFIIMYLSFRLRNLHINHNSYPRTENPVPA